MVVEEWAAKSSSVRSPPSVDQLVSRLHNVRYDKTIPLTRSDEVNNGLSNASLVESVLAILCDRAEGLGERGVFCVQSCEQRIKTRLWGTHA